MSALSVTSGPFTYIPGHTATALATASIFNTATNSDYEAWKNSFAHMFTINGLPQLARRFAMSALFMVNTQFVNRCFIQKALALTSLTADVLPPHYLLKTIPFLTTALGLSLATSAILLGYNYLNTPENLQDQVRWSNEFITTFTYSVIAISLGMVISRLALGQFAPVGSTLKKETVINLGADIVSVPLQALAALGVFHFLKAYGFNEDSMTNWQRFKMELVEGYFGLGTGHLINSGIRTVLKKPKLVQEFEILYNQHKTPEVDERLNSLFSSSDWVNNIRSSEEVRLEFELQALLYDPSTHKIRSIYPRDNDVSLLIGEVDETILIKVRQEKGWDKVDGQRALWTIKARGYVELINWRSRAAYKCFSLIHDIVGIHQAQDMGIFKLTSAMPLIGIDPHS